MEANRVQRLPTLLDVARESQVCPKTVSRVINGENNVSQTTATRVQEAIASLGFHLNDNARSLRPGQRSRMVGLVIGDLGNPFYARLASGVEEVARAHGNLLLMSSSEEDANRERDVVIALCRRRVDGMMIVPTGDDHAYLGTSVGPGTPLVFIDRPVSESKGDVVVIENRLGACRGVNSLIERGHRRIAMIADNPLMYTAIERTAGYRDALTDAGIRANEDLIRVGAHDPDRAEEMALELLDRPDPPTAFFAGNNRICIGVLRAVTRSASNCEILGFDSVELIGAPVVRLSLLSYDAAELGRQAAQLLFDRLNGGASVGSRRVEIEPRLMQYA
jgi:LacI family transcriptional regulator